MVVVEGDPAPDVSLDLRAGLKSVQVDALSFIGRQMRSMKMLSKQRPLPSIDILVPTRFSRSVRAKDVNWLSQSEVMIAGEPSLWIASFIASKQNSVSSVLEVRQASTFSAIVPCLEQEHLGQTVQGWTNGFC
jgi:hypothetical protein